MSHITKLVLKVMQQRVATKIIEEISQLQSGSRPGLGIGEGIFSLRILIERVLETQQDVYICFINYIKAFHRVKHSKMKECLREIGIDDKGLQIISKMYGKQTAVVRTENGLPRNLGSMKVYDKDMCCYQVYSTYIQKNFQRNRRYERSSSW